MFLVIKKILILKLFMKLYVAYNKHVIHILT